MEQPRPRYEEESFLIVVKRSWIYASVDFIFSMICWLYSVLVVIVVVSATVGSNNIFTRVMNSSFNMINQDIRLFIATALAVFLLFYALLFINHIYNKKRFGTLRRRRYPAPTSNAELKSLGLMDIEAIEKLQGEDYAVFETNPIVPLGGESVDQKDLYLDDHYRIN
ncbi:hypothetical protein ON064_10085 [Planococcus sp. A6]|uniref:hypothetical protein n=1 Tax=Planococcus sp. A6 TaxID=2992760 RepID=UPI00237A58AD|nr:hypothetical protein [Planococcus sp. A6]MDE0583382.1 hypothetical protein [Planococcus sp. A6]